MTRSPEMTRRTFFKALAASALAVGAVLPTGFPRERIYWTGNMTVAKPSQEFLDELFRRAAKRTKVDIAENILGASPFAKLLP